MATIQDLVALGYTVGIAWGSVEVEEAALDSARADASPQTVTRQAAEITKATLDDLAALQRLPDTDEKKNALAVEIAAAALDMVAEHANEKVEFHQRAVECAQTMPDVWHVDQSVDIVGADSVRVVSMYVACKQDGTGWDDESQAMLDALAHKPTFDDRVAQARKAVKAR